MGTFFSSSSYSYYPPLLSGLIYVHVEQSIFWASTAQIISNAARAAGSIRFISFHPLSSWVTNQPSTKKKPGWIFFSLLLLLLFSFSFLITHIINKLVEGIFWAPSKSFTLLVWEKQRQRQKKQKNKNKNKKKQRLLAISHAWWSILFEAIIISSIPPLSSHLDLPYVLSRFPLLLFPAVGCSARGYPWPPSRPVSFSPFRFELSLYVSHWTRLFLSFFFDRSIVNLISYFPSVLLCAPCLLSLSPLLWTSSSLPLTLNEFDSNLVPNLFIL